uniref:Lectin, mannose-binding 2-like a n=1 Tax=Astyanax mexicanus TaxID=7994 RepID=A0A8B9HK48_ASTMX
MARLVLAKYLIFIASLYSCLSDDDHEMEEFLKREYSLSKPYQAIGVSGSSHWELMGDTMVTTDHVRLTPDVQSKQGAVWSRIPCNLKDWELQVHFKIHGQGKKNLNGDGLAVWYTKERMQKGPVFGNKDFFTGLGVFVDTYPNEEKHIEAQKKRYTPRTQVPIHLLTSPCTKLDLSIAIFFTVLFSMLGLFLLIVVGLVVYSHWNESKRKRFY